MKATQRLHAQGKITVPIAIRKELALEDGDLVEIDVKSVDGTPSPTSDEHTEGGDSGR